MRETGLIALESAKPKKGDRETSVFGAGDAWRQRREGRDAFGVSAVSDVGGGVGAFEERRSVGEGRLKGLGAYGRRRGIW